MPEPYFRWGCVVVSSCAIGLECAGDEEGEGCGSFVGKGGRAQEREIVSVAPQGLLGRLRRLCPARLPRKMNKFFEFFIEGFDKLAIFPRGHL